MKNKLFRKILSIMVAFSLLLLGVVPSYAAPARTITVTPTEITVEVGQSVTVNMTSTGYYNPRYSAEHRDSTYDSLSVSSGRLTITGNAVGTEVVTCKVTEANGGHATTAKLTVHVVPSTHVNETPVYVYCQFIDEQGNSLNLAQMEALGYTGLYLNSSGWVTLGKLPAVNIPAPGAGVNPAPYKDTVVAALGTMENFTNRQGVQPATLIDFTAPGTQYNLTIASQGANDYIGYGYTYHLDVKAPISTLRNYTVKYVDEEGASIAEDTVGSASVGSRVPTSAKTVEGYTVIGSASKELTISGTSENVVTYTYEKNNYTVTFVDGLTGETLSQTNYKYQDSLDVPNPPTHTGYTFVNWTPAPIPSLVTGNGTYTANYVINNYDLTTSADAHSTIDAGQNYDYNATETIRVNFSADTHYGINSVKVDGVSLTGVQLASAIANGFVEVDKTGDHSVEVTSVITDQFTLGTSSDANSAIDNGQTYLYDPDGSITVNFTANTGYTITGVTVDGEALTGAALETAVANGSVTVDKASNHTVAVSATANTYTVTTNADQNSTIDATSTYTYDAQAMKEVAFSANTGYVISEVKVDGTALAGDELAAAIAAGKVSVDRTQNHSVDVATTIESYTVTTSADQNSTIDPSSEYEYDATAMKEVAFSANTGYSITGVTVDGTALAGDELDAAIAAGKVSVDRTQDHTVAVTTTANTYTVTTSADANSTIDASSSYTYDEQAMKAVAFAANTGYTVTGITIDGTALDGAVLDAAVAAGQVYVDRTQDHTVAITTTINTYTVTTTADQNSTIDPTSEYTYSATEMKEVAFAANTGYTIAGVTVDGNDLTGDALAAAIAAGKVSVDRAGDHTVAVTATINTYTLTTNSDANSTIDQGQDYDYSADGEITVNFSAARGYTITGITVDGTALAGDDLDAAVAAGNVVVDKTGDHSVAVTATINRYHLTTESDQNSSIDPEQDYDYDEDGNITVSFLAAVGHTISKVTVDGTDLTGDDLVNAIANGSITVDKVGDHYVAVEAEINLYTLATEADAHSTIDPSSEYTYDADATVDVNFTADTGYTITRVTVDGTDLAGDELAAAVAAGKVAVDRTQDHGVAVETTINTYTVTTSADQNSTIDQSSSYTYDAQAMKTVAFSPATGYTITGVTVDGVALTGDALSAAVAAGQVDVTRTGDHTVAVTATINTYEVTTSADANSTIDPSSTYEYDADETVDVNFSAATGYTITGVTVDGTALAGDDLDAAVAAGKVTVDKTGDHSVAVTTTINTYTVTTSADQNSNIDETSTYTYDASAKKVVTFAPATGYTINTVTIDGIALTGDSLAAAVEAGQVEVSRTGDHTVAVTAVINTYEVTTSSDANSTIDQGQSYDYSATETIDVAFEALNGYYISGVTVDGTPLEGAVLQAAIAAGKVTVDRKGDHSVAVSTTIDTYSTSTSADANCVIDTIEDYTYDPVETFIVAFEPHEGYSISKVTVDGVELTGDELAAAVANGYVTLDRLSGHSVDVESSINDYTVTYFVDGEQYGEAETYTYGDPVTIRPNYEKTGYLVSDWSIAEDFDMPAHDVIISASTSILYYQIVVHYEYASGAEAASDEIRTVAYGYDYSIPSPTINGYTASKTVIEGTATANREFTVVYTAIPAPIVNPVPQGTVPPTGGQAEGTVIPQPDDDIIPDEIIEDDDTPTSNGEDVAKEGAWALMNLILAILTVLFAVLMILVMNRNKIFSIGGIILAVLSVIIFFITENMALPMVMIDKWTILMAILAVATLVLMVMNKKSDNDKEDDYVAQ